MRRFYVLAVILALVLHESGFASDCGKATEHRLSGKSRTQDPCYWQQITYKLNRSAAKASHLEEELKKHAPELLHSIDTDAKNPELFAFWGDSANYDDGLGGSIVNPSVLSAISRLLKQPEGSRIVRCV